MAPTWAVPGLLLKAHTIERGKELCLRHFATVEFGKAAERADHSVFCNCFVFKLGFVY